MANLGLLVSWVWVAELQLQEITFRLKGTTVCGRDVRRILVGRPNGIFFRLRAISAGIPTLYNGYSVEGA